VDKGEKHEEHEEGDKQQDHTADEPKDRAIAHRFVSRQSR
jgi:hypothetical protein